MKFKPTIDEQSTGLYIDPEIHKFSIDDRHRHYNFYIRSNGRRLLRIGQKLNKIDNVGFDHHVVEFTLNGHWYRVDVRDGRDLLLDEMGLKRLQKSVREN